MKDNSLFRIILCFFLLGSLHSAFAQDNRPDGIGEQHPPLPYRLFRSDNAESTTEALPLVVFLHGAGERGNDNNAQLKHCIPFFLDDTITSRYPFLLLVPQCPTEKRWVNTDWSLPEHQMESEPTVELLSVIHLVDSLINCGVADSTRVYLCGISMGGFGVWDALQRWPNKFAAAIPICGGGDPVYADRMKDVPIYIFHGLQDDIVLPSRSIKMYEALQAAGSKETLLITYPDLAHDCWDEAFSTPGLFQWLFSKNNRGECFDTFAILTSIERQMADYPESTLQDIYKSFYQDRFGPGHMISDTASARSYLKRELSQMGEVSAVYYEPTGNEGKFVRVYLSAVVDGLITAEQLLDAFVRSANMVKAETDWEAEWKAVVATITKYGIQVQGFEDASLLDEASQDRQAVHHSRAYNAAYHPHYRIVERSVFEEELMPLINQGSFHKRYTLKQVVVLSRHNIRSPLSGRQSALQRITPHEWHHWSSAPSELSMRGGALETMMGQYFRKWLVSEGLMQENEIPAEGTMRFYANSLQRTIATAQYFSSGLLPVANVRIEHHCEVGKMDSVFAPQITDDSETFKAIAQQQIVAMGGEKGLVGIGEKMADNYKVLERVLDMDQSKACLEGDTCHFRTDDVHVYLVKHREPGMGGSLRLACQAADALVLQYYEEPDAVKAAFGDTISWEEWERISAIKDWYGDVLFTAPAVACQVARPLLRTILEELRNDERKFTFLCGHDSNIGSVLAALEAEEYSLPQTVEKKTPIGCKLVIEKWENAEGQLYVSLNLVYQSTEQLRNMTLLDLENPPIVFPIHLKGMNANSDGLYPYEALVERFVENL